MNSVDTKRKPQARREKEEFLENLIMELEIHVNDRAEFVRRSSRKFQPQKI